MRKIDAPARDADEPAAEGGPIRTRSRSRPSTGRSRCPALGPGEGRGQHGERGGGEQRAGDSLDSAEDDERRESGATAQSTEATPKLATPIVNTRSSPKMSPSEPPTRISDPSMSRYASTIHCWRREPSAEVVLNRLQRDVDDRAVDERHRRAENARDQRPAPDVRIQLRNCVSRRLHARILSRDGVAAATAATIPSGGRSLGARSARLSPHRQRSLPRHGRRRPVVALLGQGGLGTRLACVARSSTRCSGPGRAGGSTPSRRRCRRSTRRPGGCGSAASSSSRWSSPTTNCARCPRRHRSRTSTASRAGPWTACTGAACASEDLLAHGAPLPEAHALEFVSAEQPYVDYLTLRQASLPDVMLAWEMDGKPLLREHGAPVRVVIPDMYGYKNVKWVAEINLVAAPTMATGRTSATTATPGSGARTATSA